MKFTSAAIAAMAAAGVSAAPAASSSSAAFDGKTVAAWWGQSTHKLSEVCSDGNVDVVTLSFLTSLNPPTLNLGAQTGQPSAAQKAAKYDDLFDGTVTPAGGSSVADQIKACQSAGKKILLSFGGDSTKSKATFKDDKEAKAGADLVWDLFLGGNDKKNLRPFGSVVLDGIDLDNETGDGTGYGAFVDELRSKMGSKYIISAAPMCNQYDKSKESETSIPDSVYKNLDFVSVQFYNNIPQGLGGTKFEETIKAWSSKISKLNSKAHMMVGAPASDKAASRSGAGPAIQTADQIQKTIKSIIGMKFGNFAGVSIWDAGYAMDNSNWQKAVKTALTGGSSTSSKALEAGVSSDKDTKDTKSPKPSTTTSAAPTATTTAAAMDPDVKKMLEQITRQGLVDVSATNGNGGTTEDDN